MAEEAVTDDVEDLKNDDDPATPAPEGEGNGEDDDDLDYDQIVARDARQALEEEEAASKKTDDDEPTPEPDPKPKEQEKPKSDDEEKPKSDDVPMIPKARFDEALGQREKALEEAAYWKGQADALKSEDGKGGAEDAPPPPTPDETIAAARQANKDLAKKYDAGEITTEEWEEARSANEDAIFAAQQEKLELKAPSGKTDQQQQDDLYLDNLTAKLEKEHPYCAKVTDQGRWDYLQAEAIKELQAEGVTLGNDNRSVFTLRKRMAELTDKYGPLWEQPSQPTAGNDGDPAPTSPPPPSPKAQQRKEKLELSERQPPNPSDLGSAGQGTDTITEADIENMSDDEIAALPPATRQRILAGKS